MHIYNLYIKLFNEIIVLPLNLMNYLLNLEYQNAHGMPNYFSNIFYINELFKSNLIFI